MATTGTGLVRVTVSAPKRRVDIALPENVVVAEMLPVLLRHGGEELADQGVQQGGWALRRADGGLLPATKTLGSQRIRDGEVLHLVPGRDEWPELDYDDLVDAIASGSRRRSRAWTRRHTRTAGLTVGGIVLSLGLVAIFRSGPDWQTGGQWALAQAVLLLIAGTALSRALGDSGAGTVIALLALPFAAVGTDLLVADLGLSAQQVQVAGAVLALAAIVGYLGVGDDGALFVAAAVGGLLAVLAGWLTGSKGLEAPKSAAVVLCISLLLMPLYNSIAIWIGRLPLPVLPRKPADLIRDVRQPPRPAVYAAVARSDGLLTGLLTGTSVAAAVSMVVLIRSDDKAALWLIGICGTCYWIRSRPYVIVRQRVPVMLAGMVAGLTLLLGPMMDDPGTRLSQGGLALTAAGALAVAVGLAYSQRTLGPYLRRYVEILEILLILAVLPVAASVLGLYARLRGLG